jgi:DNA-binding NarL/FixJ family response regulator
MTATRLALVDDHPTLLKGLAALFASDGYEIIGTGQSAEDVPRLADAAPDVMILDLSMPGDVFEAIRLISRRGRTIRIVVFTAYADTELALKAFDAGALGFVLKGSPTDDLEAAIKTVLSGQIFVSPAFSPQMILAVRNRSEAKRNLAQLSPREVQIVQLLLKAKSNKEIAAELELSDKTIKHYMTNLMRKLGVRNRVEVVLAARAAQTQ